MTPRKILILCWANIGDTVVASSVIEPLHKHFPDSALLFWAKDYARESLAAHPHLSQIFSCDPFWTGSPERRAGSIRKFWATFRAVQAEHCEMAVVLNADWRSALTCAMAGIPTRIGLNRKKSSWFLSQAVRSHHSSHLLQHRAVLEAMEVAGPFGEPRWYLTPEAVSFQKAFFDSCGLSSSSVVGIHPFSADPKRNWPLDSFLKLAKSLIEQGLGPVLFLSSPGQHQTLIDLQKEIGKGCWIPPRPLGLQEMAACLGGCAQFVGNDSAAAHIALALSVKTVILFGPTDPQIYYHPSEQALYLKDASFEKMTVRKVLEAVLNQRDHVYG